jgi:hypothetical protein
MIPKAHGAWVMFAMPFAVAGGVAGRFDLPAILLATASLALFVADAPLMALVRGRGGDRAIRFAAAYLAIGLAASAILLGYCRLWILVPFGLLALAAMGVRLWQAVHRAERSMAVELLSLAGFGASAAALFAAWTGRLERTGLLLWALHFLFYVSSLFYVRLRVQSAARRERPDAGAFGRVAAGYHAALAALVTGLALRGRLPVLVALAFAPPVCRAVWAVVQRPGRVRIRRVGLSEMGISLVFAVLIIAGFRRP